MTYQFLNDFKKSQNMVQKAFNYQYMIIQEALNQFKNINYSNMIQETLNQFKNCKELSNLNNIIDNINEKQNLIYENINNSLQNIECNYEISLQNIELEL